MFKLAHIQNLFPTPLVTFMVEDAENLNRDLLAEIAQRQRNEPGESRSNREGWHSAYDLFRRKEKAQARLASIIREAVNQATQKLAPDIAVAKYEIGYEGWINVNPTGAYNTPHDHPGNLWSGTYYISVPSDGSKDGSSGKIEFIDSRSPSGGGAVRAPFTATKCSIRPKPGMLLLFPSNLLHWVHPNASEDDRVTVAFNAKFTPRIRKFPKG